MILLIRLQDSSVIYHVLGARPKINSQLPSGCSLFFLLLLYLLFLFFTLIGLKTCLWELAIAIECDPAEPIDLIRRRPGLDLYLFHPGLRLEPIPHFLIWVERDHDVLRIEALFLLFYRRLITFNFCLSPVKQVRPVTYQTLILTTDHIAESSLLFASGTILKPRIISEGNFRTIWDGMLDVLF